MPVHSSVRVSSGSGRGPTPGPSHRISGRGAGLSVWQTKILRETQVLLENPIKGAFGLNEQQII